MKICFVANTESIHTVRWVNYFINQGHDVHLISHKGFDVDGATFYPLKTIGKSKIVRERIDLMGIITYIYRAVQTAFYIRKIKPDIVHAHNVILGGFYASLSRFHPLIVTAWGTDVLVAPKISKILFRIAKLVLRKADVITCDGRNTMDAMINLAADPDKIKIIYFGIDTKKNNPLQRDAGLREKLKIFDSPTAISIRSFNPIYNVETLLHAIPIVLKQIPDAKFILVGSGPQEIYLKTLAKNNEFEKNIIFTGPLENSDVPKYIATADLYISTSLSDSGLASSTGEAMACGLPVISTDVGSIHDWIIDGESGFVIPTQNAEILAEKIIYLFRNKDLMKKLGETNRRTIVERQDYFKEMEKMEKIYSELFENYAKK